MTQTAGANRPIRRALVSVYDKTGLEQLATDLHAAGVAIVSTGSTGRGCSESRLVSMRATSSSSAIIRVSRSVSVCTDSMIIFFWSSVNLSQRASSVAVKPLRSRRRNWTCADSRLEFPLESRYAKPEGQDGQGLAAPTGNVFGSSACMAWVPLIPA